MCEQIAHAKGKMVGRMFETSGSHPVRVAAALFGAAVMVRVPTSTPSALQD